MAEQPSELLPCPFCGAGDTQIEGKGMWTGQGYSEPISVSVRHWCTEVPGQPSRMIERIGRDRASAIEAWNRRAALSQPSTEQGWTHEINQELERERQYFKGFQAGKAFAVSEQGWKLVPIEPQSAMLDRAVAFALNVKLSSDYRWTDYMKDLWATMLAGSPPPPIEPREEKL